MLESPPRRRSREDFLLSACRGHLRWQTPASCPLLLLFFSLSLAFLSVWGLESALRSAAVVLAGREQECLVPAAGTGVADPVVGSGTRRSWQQLLLLLLLGLKAPQRFGQENKPDPLLIMGCVCAKHSPSLAKRPQTSTKTRRTNQQENL